MDIEQIKNRISELSLEIFEDEDGAVINKKSLESFWNFINWLNLQSNSIEVPSVSLTVGNEVYAKWNNPEPYSFIFRSNGDIKCIKIPK